MHGVGRGFGPDSAGREASMEADGSGRGAAGEHVGGGLLDTRSADVASDLLATVGDGQRWRQDRLGTCDLVRIVRRARAE